MKKNNLVISSVIMLVFSVIAKLSGFLREIAFAYFYGATNITDAYIASTTIVSAIFAGVTVAVTTGYIPSISSINREKVSETTSNIINTVVVFIFFTSIIGVLFAENLIPFVAVDFTEETKLISANMLKIMLPFSFLQVTYNILNGYMQFNNVFWTVGVAIVLYNLVSIMFYAVSYGNTTILAVGYVLAWVVASIFLMIVARKKDFKYSFVLKPNDEVIKNVVKLGMPIFLGQLIFQLNTIIDKNFASFLGEGVMTIMKYANMLTSFVISVFVVSVVATIYPTLSKLASENNLVEYKKITSSSMNIILMFVIPLSTAFIILSSQIVEVVFLRGEFTAENAKITSQALVAYSLGLPAISLNEILNKQFYSLKDTKTPVLCNILSLSVNILLNFVLVKNLQHIGLALATSIATTVLASVLYFKLSKKMGDFDTKKLLSNLAKMIFSAVIMGMFIILLLKNIAVFTENLGNLGNVLEIMCCAFVGVPIYFALISILKIDEFNMAITFIKNKMKKA